MATFYNETGVANGSDTEEDTLSLDYSTLTGLFPNGVHLQHNDELNVKNRTNGAEILKFASIELFEVTGTRGNDVLIGGDYDRNAGYANNPFDDDQLFGNDGDDYIDGRGGDDLLLGGNGNDTLIGGSGRDELRGEVGNDWLYGGAGDWLEDTSGINHFYANEAALVIANEGTTLHANYSTYGGTGIRVENLPTGGIIRNGIGGSLVFDGGMAFDIRGTQQDDVMGVTYNLSNNDFLFGNGGNDLINGGNGNDYLSGDAGNDTLIGGSGLDKLFGGDGDDLLNDTEGFVSGGGGFNTLVADYSQLNYNGAGIHLGYQGEQTVRERSTGSVILDYQEIQNFNIKGTNNADVLVGGNLNDILDGGLGDDSIEGGQGDDHLFATHGSDTVKGGDGNDVIYAVAGVNNAVKQLFGGDGEDRYVLDVRGDVTLGFNFNTTTLANFVNAVTLPELKGTDWEQIGTDIAFDAAGAVLGAVPGVGPALSFMTSLAQTGFASYQETKELEDKINTQITKANTAALEYKQADWGNITTSGARDVVVINDFKIGIDTILLPKLPQPADANDPAPRFFYEITSAQGDNLDGVYVSIRQQAGGISNSVEQLKSVVYIANNYNSNIGDPNTERLSTAEFEALMKNLLVGSQVGKFYNDSITGDNNTVLVEELNGSFANDLINGNGGRDEIFGYFGDDALHGDAGNDVIYGGSNQNAAWLKYERSANNPDAPYLNDGNDFISGGEGDDILYGESGNDFLSGDGFKESPTGESIAVGNGNDKLFGGSGNDKLLGGAGNDLLNGGTGVDQLSGGAGNDSYIVDNIRDTLVENGGGGIDTVFSTVKFTLGANVENLTLTGVNAVGGAGNSLNNIINGNNNTNGLSGLSGNDSLNGNGGNDSLNGGLGNDLLNGGAGNDSFLFNTALGLNNKDTITGYVLSNDRLVLDDAVFIRFSGLTGVQAANIAINATGAAQDVNDYLVYNTTTHALSYDADGSGSGAAIQFATVDLVGVNAATLAGEFAIV